MCILFPFSVVQHPLTNSHTHHTYTGTAAVEREVGILREQCRHETTDGSRVKELEVLIEQLQAEHSTKNTNSERRSRRRRTRRSRYEDEDEDEDDEFHRKIVKSRHVLNGIVQDITLLSECDVLIGTCMSQVSRMAAELMVDRMIAPPIAMDLALCRSFPAHFVDIEMEWRSYMGVGV